MTLRDEDIVTTRHGPGARAGDADGTDTGDADGRD